MTILLLFTHPNVIKNLHDCVYSYKKQMQDIIQDAKVAVTVKVDGDWSCRAFKKPKNDLNLSVHDTKLSNYFRGL